MTKQPLQRANVTCHMEDEDFGRHAFFLLRRSSLPLRLLYEVYRVSSEVKMNTVVPQLT